jgi:hypothetical protein
MRILLEGLLPPPLRAGSLLWQTFSFQDAVCRDSNGLPQHCNDSAIQFLAQAPHLPELQFPFAKWGE